MECCSLHSITGRRLENPGVGDLDGDARPDLIWQHVTSGALGVWFTDDMHLRSGVPLSPPAVADLGWRLAAKVSSQSHCDLPRLSHTIPLSPTADRLSIATFRRTAMPRTLAFMFVALVHAVVALAQSSAPTRLIPYSGTATDAAGGPLTGAVTVTFALYEDQDGGGRCGPKHKPSPPTHAAGMWPISEPP